MNKKPRLLSDDTELVGFNSFDLCSDAVHHVLTFLTMKDLCRLQPISQRTRKHCVKVISCKKEVVVTDQNYSSVAAHCSHIETLKFGYKSRSDYKEELAQILDKTHVSSICFYGHRPLIWQCFAAKANSLTDLDANTCRSDEYLPVLQSRGEQLKSLHCLVCGISDLMNVVQYCPNLEMLSFRNHRTFHGDRKIEFSSLLQKTPRLKNLHMRNAKSADYQHLKNFSHLSFETATDPPSNIFQCTFPNLVELSFGCFTMDESVGAMSTISVIGNTCPNLRKFSYKFPQRVDVVGLSYVLKKVTKLEELVSSGSHKHLQVAFEQLCDDGVVLPNLIHFSGVLASRKTCFALGVVAPNLKTARLYSQDKREVIAAFCEAGFRHLEETILDVMFLEHAKLIDVPQVFDILRQHFINKDGFPNLQYLMVICGRFDAFQQFRALQKCRKSCHFDVWFPPNNDFFI